MNLFASKNKKNAKDGHTPEPTHEYRPEEEKFDKAVYGGISYFAQAFTGIGLTYWLQHMGGRKYFDKLGEWAGPNIVSRLRPSIKGEEAVRQASSSIIVSTMIMVGNTFLIPVKLLENKKPQIVRGMVKKNNAKRAECGNPLSEEEKAHQEKLLTKLEEKPKQDWWSLGFGRAFGLAGVYAVLLGPMGKGRNQKVEELIGDGVANTLSASGVQSKQTLTVGKNLGGLFFNDMFYSAISAGGLYIYSHFIKPPKETGAPIADTSAALAQEKESTSEYPKPEQVRQMRYEKPKSLVSHSKSVNYVERTQAPETAMQHSL